MLVLKEQESSRGQSSETLIESKSEHELLCRVFFWIKIMYSVDVCMCVCVCKHDYLGIYMYYVYMYVCIYVYI